MGSANASLLDFVLSVLRAFGFDDFVAKLSTRPPDKSVGEDELWSQAADGLRDALDTCGLDYVVDEGGGAFYGPKIDVDVGDAIGRSWQLSTVQLDFNLPERFDLEYISADGSRKRPVTVGTGASQPQLQFCPVIVGPKTTPHTGDLVIARPLDRFGVIAVRGHIAVPGDRAGGRWRPSQQLGGQPDAQPSSQPTPTNLTNNS